MLTLIEMAKRVNDPLISGFIEEMYIEETLMQYVPFKSINGLAIQFNRESALPDVGFRKINGSFAESSGEVKRIVEALRFMGGDSDTDRAFIKAYGNGERAANDGMYAKAVAVKWAQWMIYGNSGTRTGNAYDDIDGFDGLHSVLPSTQKIDGTGSTGSDGSTVIALRFGAKYFSGIQTPDGIDVRDLGELQDKPAMRTRCDWDSGYALFNSKSSALIYDLTVAAGLTVGLMDELHDLIPGGPDVYVMSTRSRRQLKDDATTNYTTLGTTLDQLGRPIETWGGVPVITSECILDTETVA